ncbi:MAG: OmpH family outer membrane protein [Desulfovibrio sp.]|uniref:OmpH family outer membrane protein n=1 Tax=Desulfovibrio sp. 7SRBS1 TaxID=3378064 RepID=UPI003B3CAB2C
MRQKLTVLFAIALLVLAVGCNEQSASSSPRVAVVDANKVMQECAPGKQAIGHLEEISNKVRKDIEPLQEAIKKDQSDQESMKKFQETLGKAQKLLTSEQDRLFGQLNKAFTERLEAYRKANNFSVVLLKSQVLAYDGAADITNAMVKEMDGVKLSLETPKTEEKAEPAAAAEESAEGSADKKAE